MQIRLDGRVALITGGSKGLGLATATRMAASGAQVAILARDAGVLEAAAAEIRANVGGDVAAFACNVAEAAAVEATFGAVVERFGKVDIVVNNAGAHMSGPFETITDEMWRQDIDLKLMAAVRLSRLAFPGMRARRWGRIINILNIMAKAPRGRATPTSVSRAAAMNLTKALAFEGAPDNILVNGLVVGLIESDQWRRAYKAGGSKGEYADFLRSVAERQQVPMGRVGQAEEFANVACFLASDAASYVTGSVIHVDGGATPVV